MVPDEYDNTPVTAYPMQMDDMPTAEGSDKPPERGAKEKRAPTEEEIRAVLDPPKRKPGRPPKRPRNPYGAKGKPREPTAAPEPSPEEEGTPAEEGHNIPPPVGEQNPGPLLMEPFDLRDLPEPIEEIPAPPAELIEAGAGTLPLPVIEWPGTVPFPQGARGGEISYFRSGPGIPQIFGPRPMGPSNRVPSPSAVPRPRIIQPPPVQGRTPSPVARGRGTPLLAEDLSPSPRAPDPRMRLFQTPTSPMDVDYTPLVPRALPRFPRTEQ